YIIFYNTYLGVELMDNKTLEHFRSKLLEEKQNTGNSLEDIKKRQEETKELLNNELSSYDNHPGDIGTEVYMMEQDRGFIKQLKNTIEEIDQALEGIEDGKYGYCDNCHKEISIERLEAIPYAKSCLECSDEEAENKEIKFEIKDYKELENRNYTSKDNMGYDREDGFRDVMKDNIVPKDPSYSTGDNMGIEDDME
ncbi:MAG TPA: TraR/DksA C4-type zinc finger protein, partial [Clostridia bacterium]|nr:TraR/DksA C4-type zinc finger protein [Clostridia bacterium]